MIGSGRSSDELLVTPDVKREVVSHLQTRYDLFGACFGDSPIDIPMLRQADRAIVVVGDEQSRSKSMEDKLRQAIVHDGLLAEQVLFPGGASPRFDVERLPLLKLTPQQIEHMVCVSDLPFEHATQRKAAKLLQTPMRDSKLSGLALQKAHTRAGEYLVTEFLSSMIGLEEVEVKHVQGNATTGYRLAQEDRTVVVPLMRGGDPMGRGVWEVFPLAMYKHADKPIDLHDSHLQGRSRVILVDSVVNTGGSIIDFVKHIRKLGRSIPIVVVTGVVQQDAVSKGGPLHRANYRYGNTSVVASRQLKNKYKGKGGTDSGNRLFNTTHLD